MLFFPIAGKAQLEDRDIAALLMLIHARVFIPRVFSSSLDGKPLAKLPGVEILPWIVG